MAGFTSPAVMSHEVTALAASTPVSNSSVFGMPPVATITTSELSAVTSLTSAHVLKWNTTSRAVTAQIILTNVSFLRVRHRIDTCVKISIMLPMNAPVPRQRGSKELWLNAAYDLLIADGIDGVKIMPLAKRLNLSRTGFYWFFKDISELHGALIHRWESQNTGNLIERCNIDAANICEALFNLMDCWLEPAIFDAQLDLVIRNWARVDADLQRRIDVADRTRIDAIAGMFTRHGFSFEQADVRSLTVIYTQIGYISMQVEENRQDRLARVQHYVELFAGVRPAPEDVQRFLDRHHT